MTEQELKELCRANGVSFIPQSVCRIHELYMGWYLFGRWPPYEVAYSRTFVSGLSDARPSSWQEVLEWVCDKKGNLRDEYKQMLIVPGIGRTHARNIVAHFGLQTFDVIEKQPERLAEVEGIGKKRIEKIKASWQKQRGVKDVMVFLQSHGVSPAYAAKIYKEYGKDSIKKVKENPYCLADDIFGIGFKMADAIASTLGYGRNDHRRLRAGILYTLTQLATDGHCFAESGQLMKAATELLQADGQPLGEALRGMIADNSLCVDGEAIYLPMYYYAECGVANKLRRLMVSE